MYHGADAIKCVIVAESVGCAPHHNREKNLYNGNQAKNEQNTTTVKMGQNGYGNSMKITCRPSSRNRLVWGKTSIGSVTTEDYCCRRGRCYCIVRLLQCEWV